jgi:subtilisin family serine protease
MPHADLPVYRDGFFEKFLADLPGTPTLAQIEQQQPAGQPAVLMGDYVEYSGPALTPLPNASITPQFAVRVEAGGSPQTYVMLWVVERFDVATDSPETIARILADFRPPTASGSAESSSISSDLARTWSQALTADAVRQALARNLSDITAAPAGLPTSDLEALRTFLGHFGTYKADGSYYAKGAVAEGTFPAGVSEAYLAPDTGNLAEVKLPRAAFYCYALVTERLWNPQADPSRVRQLVYRIEDRGADAPDRWRLALIHTVGASQTGAAPFSRFIFFQAGVGLGLAVAESARRTLDSAAAALIEQLPGRLADLPATLADPSTPIVGTQESPYILFIGAVTEAFPATDLPEGVIADGEGAIRIFRCPPQHAMALAERTDIENLELSANVYMDMQQAMAEINMAGRVFPAGITAANTGQGVVVGIIDSGIDGGHPAFLGRSDDPTRSRIHSVWNLWQSGGDSPLVRSGNNAAYRSMNFGREYIGHDEVITTRDHPIGHGTHVSGIAAGRAFGTTWPGGIAPAATLVVVSVGTVSGFVNDVVAGVKYCFQKATELGLPCVVNISLGTERHSHDGTDPLSIALTQLVSQNRVPASGLGTLPSAMPSYIEGRVVCASAGNLRGDNVHWQASIPAGGDVSVLYQPFDGGATSDHADDGVTFWAYNEDATTVRLRLSTRHSSNAVLATPEVPLMSMNRANTTNLAGGLRVNIHNGPERPNNRHFSPEIYWLRPAPAAPVATAPWIIRIRNEGRSACVIHGFCAFREHRGRFIFDAAQTNPLIGVTYTPDQLRQFESHKISTPGTANGTICVAAFTSRLGGFGAVVDELAPFSSPGPMRAVGPGQRAIDVALPGDPITSAKAWTTADPTRGVTDMSGTSMASPMMTGVVAYLLQLNRRLTTGQIRTRIELAATRRATDPIDDWGLGRLDVSRLQP